MKSVYQDENIVLFFSLLAWWHPAAPEQCMGFFSRLTTPGKTLTWPGCIKTLIYHCTAFVNVMLKVGHILMRAFGLCFSFLVTSLFL